MKTVAKENYYLDQLQDYACQCGGLKERGTPFCVACLHELPVHLAADLKQPIGQGFEEALDAAGTWLLYADEVSHGEN